jgi:hypothetical protein
VRRKAAWIALAAVLAGCGGSSSPAKQAEELESFAAEGALLAEDAAAGDTTSAFARVHARELQEQAEALERQASDRRLRLLAKDVARELRRLAEDPGDRRAAARAERTLRKAAQVAGELAP